jgi:hypothetical protein
MAGISSGSYPCRHAGTFLPQPIFQIYKVFLLNVLCFFQNFLIFLFLVPDVFSCPTQVKQLSDLGRTTV